MGASYWIRWTHRWLSVVFTLAVVVNFAMVAVGRYQNWVGLLAVAPLLLMLATGLYMFVLPYVRRSRTASV